jgi:hypothetical protein
MNNRQWARYPVEAWSEGVTMWKRHARCGYCSYSVALNRSGANALATTARLRGKIMAHLREVHPDKLLTVQQP